MTPDPPASSRSSATLSWPAEQSRSTRIHGELDLQGDRQPAAASSPSQPLPATRGYTYEASLPTGAVGTLLPSEYFPGLQYAIGRLGQMLQRSRFELEPYPGEWLIRNAYAWARALLAPGVPTPSVVPSEDGNVSFVWHKGGWDIEVEIGLMVSEVWAAARDGSRELEGRLDERLSDLSALLREIAHGRWRDGD